jgi:hypothetical protein
MAPLNPSAWVVPRVKKGTDPPDPDLHATDIHILTLRHKNGPWAITRRRIGVILPLKKLIRSSQKFNLVSHFNQVLPKNNQVSDFNQVRLDSITGLDLIRKHDQIR